MKKRAVSSLLVTLIIVSFILPALATEAEMPEMPEYAIKVLGGAVEAEPEPEIEIEIEIELELEIEPEPNSFILLEGEPRFVEYEVYNGITYITVSSFVAMADPRAVVEEEGGVVTVSSARVGQVVDGEGNATDVVQETLSMTVSTQLPYIVANERYLYAKDSVILLNGRVAVPIRTLAKVFNFSVDYDAASCAALLTHDEGSGAYLLPGGSYYDGDTLYWLSRVIFAESGHQVLEGKIAVGNVVMNRVSSPLFPDTLYGVLTQKNQFVSINTLSKKTPNSESVIAAKLVMDGTEVLPTALFFNKTGLSSYAYRTRSYVATIGNHDFYA